MSSFLTRRPSRLVFTVVTAIWLTRAAVSAVGPAADSQRAAGAAPKAPTALGASGASRSEVALTWTSGDPSVTKFAIERKAAGTAWAATPATFTPTPAMPTPSTVLVVDAAHGADTKIDPFATYTYRARGVDAAGVVSGPSNEITVGPPPTGFSQVIVAPKAMQEHDPNQFAALEQMVLDANGDPAIAYVVADLNSDGDPNDSELNFISWDRAHYKWNAPVTLATVADIVRSGSRKALSIALDSSTGRLAVAYTVNTLELHITSSVDGGVIWTDALVGRTQPEQGQFYSPSIALGNGRVYLAFMGNNGFEYRTGLATDPPAKWTSSKPAVLAGASEVRSEGIAVGLDGAGQPAVTYWLNPNDGYSLTLAFWRPGQPSAVKILDTANHQTDDPASALAMSGTQAAVVIYANRDDLFFENHQIWFARSMDNGATWGPPVAIPNDGGNAMGSPLSLSLDRAGHPAASVELTGGNSDGTKCGRPKLLRSTDGVRWTVCAPNTRGFAANDDTFGQLAFAGNDKLYLAFHSRQPGGGLQPGLVLWREP